MVRRAWLVIPAMGVAVAAIAISRNAAPLDAPVVGLAGSAIAAAARGLVRDDGAAPIIAAVVAASVAGFTFLGVAGDALDAVAIAAAGFALSELALRAPADATPD